MFILRLTHPLQGRRAAFAPRGCGSMRRLLWPVEADEAADGGHSSFCLWRVVFIYVFLYNVHAYLILVVLSSCVFALLGEKNKTAFV